MKRLEIVLGKPAGKPVTIIIKGMDRDYSEVKLYYPKDQQGRPLIAPKKQWYVYYYYRSPFTGFMEKIKDTHKINRYKTAAERMEAGKAWVKAISLLLDNGFNPFTEKGIEDRQLPQELQETFTVRSGLQHAFDNKLGTWKKSTADDYKTRMGVFLEYAELNRFDSIDIRDLKDTHIIGYLNWLTNPKGRGVGKTSQDNYKRAISGLLGKLKKDRIIEKNPASDIETKKGRPEKNKPFTGKEVRRLKEWMLQHDRKLYEYVMLMIYTFLRGREIVRLRVKDIHLDQKYLYADTKGDTQAIKKLIEPVITMLAGKELKRYPEGSHIFTNTGEIELWDADEKTKVDHFAYRFRQAKAALGFGKDYGLYSFRHSAALDLYHSFVRSGHNDHEAVLKIMPIIGHQDPETTRNYLRDIGGMLPKDYSNLFTLDF